MKAIVNGAMRRLPMMFVAVGFLVVFCQAFPFGLSGVKRAA